MLATVIAIVAAASISSAGENPLNVIDLGTLGGDTIAYDVNASGEVVGSSETPAGTLRAFHWVNGVMTDLGTLGFQDSVALGLNDAGDVVGVVFDGFNPSFPFFPFFNNPHPFVCSEGAMSLLSTPNGLGRADDINSSGQIAGVGAARAARWDGGVMTDLSAPGFGQLSSFAYAINEAGVIAGGATAPIEWRPAKWVGNAGEFTGPQSSSGSDTYGINDAGFIVGRHPGFAPLFGARWLPTGGALFLGFRRPRDINNSGQVVGSDLDRAVSWSQGTIVDLNDLLPAGSPWVLMEAWALNDDGLIVGSGTLDGATRAFLANVAELTIDLVDPVPDLLAGPAVTTDPEMLAVGGRPIGGLVADGVTRIVIRVSDLPGPGTVELSIADEFGDDTTVGVLRTPGNAEDLTTLIVPTVELADGSHVAFAILIAPEDFVRRKFDLDDPVRFIDLSGVYTPEVGSVVLSQMSIRLHRPPILLLHGIWSSARTWEWILNPFVFSIVYKHDYEGTNAQPFHQNVVQAFIGVRNTLERRRASVDVAVTQVDVVAHSMGGLLTRMYVSEHLPSPPYYRNENFLEGDVNRLITLGTPHKGSEVADVLMALALSPGIVPQAIVGQVSKVLGCVPCGAAFDLRTNSQPITTLGAVPIPGHAVAGVGGDDVWQKLDLIITLADTLWGRGWASLIISAISPKDVFGPPPVDHDLVVSRTSAEGGLPSGSTVITLVEYVPFVQWGDHSDLTKIPFVQDTVEALLNTPVSHQPTWAQFPAANPPPAPGGFQIPDYGNVVEGLVISDPPPGTMVTAGNSVSVTVTPTNGFVPTSVTVLSDVDADAGAKAPYVFQHDIPVQANGTVTLTAMGLDAALNMAVSQELVLLVDVAATLTGISFEQDEVYVYGLSPQLQTHVFGSYDDGVDRDLTGAALDTVYISLDPSIADVDTDGQLTSVAVGQTTIQAANGGFITMLPVTVVSLPCPGDFDLDGQTGITDLLTLLAAWGPNPGHPADFDGDGTVGITDLLTLLAAWGPCP